MRDFVFHNPTKIIFGRTALTQIGHEAAFLGKNALVVYGAKSCRENGSLQEVISILHASGLTVAEFGGITPNPTLAKAREGIALARKEKTDILVALGGGSVIDCAKAIAAGTTATHDLWLFFRGKKSIRTTLPLLAVPTVAGSGSEANSGMVLTNEDSGQKIGIGNRHLFPRAAFLNPALTSSLPAETTAFGAVDALSHLLEFYLFREESFSPVQDGYSEGLMKTIMESCEQALAAPGEYLPRANLMWASSLALNGISASGLGKVGFPCHMIEHSLSALYGVPHGAGLAALLPGFLTFLAENSAQRLAIFAQRVLNLTAPDQRQLAQRGAERLGDWFRQIGAPSSLTDLGISAGEILRISENTREQARLWRLTEYCPEVVREILLRCL